MVINMVAISRVDSVEIRMVDSVEISMVDSVAISKVDSVAISKVDSVEMVTKEVVSGHLLHLRQPVPQPQHLVVLSVMGSRIW